ncbi:leucyl aminopeptidase family protein [Catenuloplanes atrovinosus]|uniref:Probable cytosol aminopeptidase n=1 Tax=Catenuloplanes atrovinosus TaxID=137266 RepID=A0AAE4CDX2_9ACTN|nr:leucyl aminopeptidase family protein [Catenuloplanes atrovinosus]MDR7280573.1 leucyl aminopeptidase [Catenuloplanes atrovinosus]
MPNVRLVSEPDLTSVVVLPVRPVAEPAEEGPAAELVAAGHALPADVTAEVTAFLAESEATGRAGSTVTLPRPTRTPAKLIFVGVGDADEAGWRAAGAAVSRAVDTAATVLLPSGVSGAAVRGLAEGLHLGAYRFTVPAEFDEAGPEPAEIALAAGGDFAAELTTASVVAAATALARDWTNTPSSIKSPDWLAAEMAAAGDRPGLDGVGGRAEVVVRDAAWLREQGFGGVLAVGGGSANEPRLVEATWSPEGATRHVVLVGKGITFDTGGISIKPVAAMKLMRKDMGGAAAVVAAVHAAAALRLPVRVTALAPLAENMVSGSAFRPGDVVRHFGGMTSETTNSDAEGRLVLADAMAYAVQRLAPDLLIDLATLTGANAVALGKTMAALYSPNDALAKELADAAEDAGEHAWRMPLADEYADTLRSDIADVYSAPPAVSSISAALFLREFTGDLRNEWAHFDMSAPSWSDGVDGVLAKGATGWGVRTLVRWLRTL